MVYVFTRVLRFPDNTIIAWIKHNYHEQGNIIIILLLLPLGHISNTSIIIFYSTHSAMSMACAHVLHKSWKSWSVLKSMNQLLGSSSGLCMMGAFCVTKMKHGQTIWFCRDKISLAMLFDKTLLLGWYAWSIIVFMSTDRLLLWITRVLIFMPWLDIWSRLC